jgi:2-iminobutanoate/2-iminopropanoate deaminase
VSVEGVGRLPAFSHATVAGDLIFVSGMLGTKPGSTELVQGGVGPQTRQALLNVEAILAAEDATLRDVAKCTVYLADMADYAAMNEAYVPFFEGSPPARATIAAGGLALGAALEIDCIAQRPAARSED